MKHKISLSLFLLLVFLSCVSIGIPDDLYSVPATNSSNVSMMESTGLWSEILENWIVSNSKIKRMSKVMKLGDKSLTVTSKISTPNKREVSETDLYLLGAIEKLVYRVDFLESRLRRAEELLYYVISGTINKKGKLLDHFT